MDLSNPKTWQGGISIMMEVPHIVVPLVILLMGGVWWLRGTIERSVKDGLKAQVGALSERLQLAHDQQGAVTSKLDTAKVETAALQRKVSKFLSEPAVVEATANVVGQYKWPTRPMRHSVIF